MIKELAAGFEREFSCPGEYTEKYKAFSIPLKKKLKELKPEIKLKVERKI